MSRVEAHELAAWFDAHGAPLVLYARQWVDPGLADDLVQEVFVRLASVSERPLNVRAWLMTCVRHAAMDALRRNRRERHRDQRAAQDRELPLLVPCEAGHGRLEAEEIQAALLRLPSEAREILTLRIWNDATFEEISEVTGLPLTTVFRRYREALESIRQHWEVPCPKK